MFYRPDFCCGCGEKIERTDWKPWTSTRFCELCSTEHQLVEIGPKVLIVIGVLVGCLGIGTLLKGPPVPGVIVAKQTFASQTNSAEPGRSKLRTTDVDTNQSQRSSPVENTNVSKPVTTAGNIKSESPSANEAIYFCGAETKKGTPCTRKVKGNVRCWQHRGMPAMLAPEKLAISR